ncbi:MAG TPA: adenylate/guanylate cyclase domain-containing protein [Longimicrobiales bacterium]|nr:adenylate/guanylate cyclase domain-containing protein [Longimicrobiales bacterium]
MSESPEPGRRLAAVWFADIVGYTALSSRDEDAALRVVAAFQRIAEEVVTQHSGRVVKYIGDAALAEFASTDGAIRSALTLMERFVEDEAARRHGTTLRIGVNVGEVIPAADGDIYGDGVNLASRLQNQAAPGQVIASEAVHAQIRQRPVFRTEPLGQRAVKGISGPVTLYAVTLQEAGGAQPAPPPAVQVKAVAAQRPSRKWLVPAVVAAVVVGVGGLVVVNPGGRILPGAPVTVTRASFPVVEGGMEIGAAVTVAFSGAIDPATATSANVRLLDASGDPVAAEVAVGDDEHAIEIRPLATLAYGADYTLVLGDAFRDAGGRPVRAADGSGGEARFPIRAQPIPSGTPPGTAEVAGPVRPQGPVTLRFGQDMDARKVDAQRVRLTAEHGVDVQADVALAEDRRTARLTPAGPLAVGARYTVYLDSTLTTATGLPVATGSLSFRVAAGAPARSEPQEEAPTQAVAQPATQPSARPAAEPPTVQPGSGTGPATLNLQASPAAALPFLKVVVDGDTLGPPPVTGVKLAEGRSHTVSVVGVPELSSYTLVVFRREVSPQPGQILNIAADITAFGSIDVISQPAGTVFVDGRQVGRTPLAGFPVTAGVVHRLEIRPTAADAGRFSPYSGEFRVGPLEWKSLGRVSLPPKS